MMGFKVAQDGAKYPAAITRCEVTTAADVFTSKDGIFNGKTSPEDPVMNIYGRIDEQAKETKLGTLRLPKDGEFLSNKANLYKLYTSLGFDLNNGFETSDDFSELVGKSVKVTKTASGFWKLALD
jgi:hypothetical protein